MDADITFGAIVASPLFFIGGAVFGSYFSLSLFPVAILALVAAFLFIVFTARPVLAVILISVFVAGWYYATQFCVGGPFGISC